MIKRIKQFFYGIITHDYIVERKHREWDSWQNLIEQYYIFGLPFVRNIVDQEEIPREVYLNYLCFGDTGGWRSKFAEYINAQNLRKQAKEKEKA